MPQVKGESAGEMKSREVALSTFWSETGKFTCEQALKVAEGKVWNKRVDSYPSGRQGLEIYA